MVAMNGKAQKGKTRRQLTPPLTQAEVAHLGPFLTQFAHVEPGDGRRLRCGRSRDEDGYPRLPVRLASGRRRVTPVARLVEAIVGRDRPRGTVARRRVSSADEANGARPPGRLARAGTHRRPRRPRSRARCPAGKTPGSRT